MEQEDNVIFAIAILCAFSLPADRLSGSFNTPARLWRELHEIDQLPACGRQARKERKTGQRILTVSRTGRIGQRPSIGCWMARPSTGHRVKKSETRLLVLSNEKTRIFKKGLIAAQQDTKKSTLKEKALPIIIAPSQKSIVDQLLYNFMDEFERIKGIRSFHLTALLDILIMKKI